MSSAPGNIPSVRRGGCDVTGTALVTSDPGRRLRWKTADPEIHVASQMLNGRSDREQEHLESMYRIGAWCEDEQAYHATRIGPDPECPTCGGMTRETVGLVCQTCGHDFDPGRPA